MKAMLFGCISEWLFADFCEDIHYLCEKKVAMNDTVFLWCVGLSFGLA